jgi:hypothetical protein
MQSNDTPTELRQRLQTSLNRSAQVIGPAISTLFDVRLRGDLILEQNPPFETELVVLAYVRDLDRLAGAVPSAVYSNTTAVDLCEALAMVLAGLRAALPAEQAAELTARMARNMVGQVRIGDVLAVDNEPPTSGTVH